MNRERIEIPTPAADQNRPGIILERAMPVPDERSVHLVQDNSRDEAALKGGETKRERIEILTPAADRNHPGIILERAMPAPDERSEILVQSVPRDEAALERRETKRKRSEILLPIADRGHPAMRKSTPIIERLKPPGQDQYTSLWEAMSRPPLSLHTELLVAQEEKTNLSADQALQGELTRTPAEQVPVCFGLNYQNPEGRYNPDLDRVETGISHGPVDQRSAALAAKNKVKLVSFGGQAISQNKGSALTADYAVGELVVQGLDQNLLSAFPSIVVRDGETGGDQYEIRFPYFYFDGVTHNDGTKLAEYNPATSTMRLPIVLVPYPDPWSNTTEFESKPYPTLVEVRFGSHVAVSGYINLKAGTHVVPVVWHNVSSSTSKVSTSEALLKRIFWSPPTGSPSGLYHHDINTIWGPARIQFHLRGIMNQTVTSSVISGSSCTASWSSAIRSALGVDILTVRDIKDAGTAVAVGSCFAQGVILVRGHWAGMMDPGFDKLSDGHKATMLAHEFGHYLGGPSFIDKNLTGNLQDFSGTGYELTQTQIQAIRSNIINQSNSSKRYNESI